MLVTNVRYGHVHKRRCVSECAPLAGALLQLQQQTEHAQTAVSQEAEECVVGQEVVIQQPWNTPQQGSAHAVRHHQQPTLDVHTETKSVNSIHTVIRFTL